MPEPLLTEDFLRRIEKLHLVSRKIVRGRLKGERRSKRRGYSSEFADYRNYVEGDDLRFVDWNIYGRLDKLFLKLFLEEEDLHVHLLIDASLSMNFGTPTKFDHARRVAAALGFIGLSSTDRVRFHFLSGGLIRSSDAFRGKPSARRAFDFLEQTSPAGSTDLAAACRAFSLQRGASTGVALLISDFLDPDGFEETIRALGSNGLDLHVLHLLTPEEIDPSLKGDLRLVDIEDSTAQEITISRPLLNQYAETLQRFQAGLRTACRKRGIGYTFSSTDIPFDTLVLRSLRDAQVVT